jgi:hypothetical protein
MEFVSRWKLLNYDPKSLKVAKLTSEVEARRGEAGGRSEVRSIGLWATYYFQILNLPSKRMNDMKILLDISC